jgi:hypothetical protein
MPAIILSDNGVSSGSAGLKTTASNDGILALQTTTAGGTATTAVTIDTSQNVIVPVGRITKTGTATSITLNTGEAYSASNALAVISTDSGASAINLRMYNVSYYYPFQFSNNGVMSVGGATASTSGAGITFPATASKSSNLNTLDDYEEGEWTPTYVTDNVGFSSITYNTTFTKGTYTKVGNLVTLTGYIRTEALTKGSASGNLYISGLPFSNGGTGSDFTKWRAYGSCNGSNFSSGAPDRVYLGNGLSSMNMVRINALNAVTAGVATVIADLSTGTGVNVVEFAISYHTED